MQGLTVLGVLSLAGVLADAGTVMGSFTDELQIAAGVSLGITFAFFVVRLIKATRSRSNED